jgi:hypothetical protein
LGVVERSPTFISLDLLTLATNLNSFPSYH